MTSTAQSGRWREDSRWNSNADADASKKASREAPERTVRITQQFRERHNMTYELDCRGVPLVLRIFFPVEASEGQWRLEASTAHTQPAYVVSASASDKAQALQSLAQSWRDAAPAAVSTLDWAGIAQAMAAVRAI